MAEPSLRETIRIIEQAEKHTAELFGFLRGLTAADQEYFTAILQKRDHLPLLLETELTADEIQKGLVYNIAFHGLAHLECPGDDLHRELAATVHQFSLLRLVEGTGVDMALFEHRFLSAYSGMLLLSQHVDHKRAAVERALLKEFKTGGALQEGLWGYTVDPVNFKRTQEILSQASAHTLARLL